MFVGNFVFLGVYVNAIPSNIYWSQFQYFMMQYPWVDSFYFIFSISLISAQIAPRVEFFVSSPRLYNSGVLLIWREQRHQTPVTDPSPALPHVFELYSSLISGSARPRLIFTKCKLNLHCSIAIWGLAWDWVVVEVEVRGYNISLWCQRLPHRHFSLPRPGFLSSIFLIPVLCQLLPLTVITPGPWPSHQLTKSDKSLGSREEGGSAFWWLSETITRHSDFFTLTISQS